jgi:hypothetical protein
VPLPGGENPTGFHPVDDCPFIRESAGWQAEHRNAAAVRAITWRTLRVRNAAALRCSAGRGRCRMRGEDEEGKEVEEGKNENLCNFFDLFDFAVKIRGSECA